MLKQRTLWLFCHIVFKKKQKIWTNHQPACRTLPLGLQPSTQRKLPAGSSRDESCTSFARSWESVGPDPPPSPCRCCFQPQEKLFKLSKKKKNPSFLESKAIILRVVNRKHYDFLFFLIFFRLRNCNPFSKPPSHWTSSILFDASFHLRRLVSTNSCPTSVGKPWSYLVQEVVMLGTSMVRRVVVGHVVNPSRFFYVFFCGVFLWGGGRKRKEWKRSFFGRRNLILFLFFFVFLGHFRFCLW